MNTPIAILESHLEIVLTNQAVASREHKVAEANRLAVEAKEIEEAIRTLKENR